MKKSDIYDTFKTHETIEISLTPAFLELPHVCGWYAVALNPVNYNDFENDLQNLNPWRTSFGFNVKWFNNGKFWDNDTDITDRVTHWGNCPIVPLY